MKLNSFLLSATALLIPAGVANAQAPKDATTAPQAEPHMQKVLDALTALSGKPIETLSPVEARAQPTPADAVMKVMQSEGKSTAPDPAVSKISMTIPGPHGVIPIHVFTPTGKGPFPVMLYYHGGGFVIADTKTYEASPRALAKGAQAIMVAVDYHQAPEFKFPAAVDDAYVAYIWVLQHAQELNGDPKRVAVGGESAGGNLATVVSMMALESKAQMPVHQLLVYPVVNNDFNTSSYRQNAQAKPLNKAMMAWFFKHYSASRDDGNNPHAVPMKANSLKGLPPATIIAAEIDPLLSEGKDYAARLQKDGVKVTYKEYTGVAHEFFGMGAVVPKAKEAEQLAVDELKKAFARTP